MCVGYTNIIDTKSFEMKSAYDFKLSIPSPTPIVLDRSDNWKLIPYQSDVQTQKLGEWCQFLLQALVYIRTLLQGSNAHRPSVRRRLLEYMQTEKLRLQRCVQNDVMASGSSHSEGAHRPSGRRRLVEYVKAEKLNRPHLAVKEALLQNDTAIQTHLANCSFDDVMM